MKLWGVEFNLKRSALDLSVRLWRSWTQTRLQLYIRSVSITCTNAKLSMRHNFYEGINTGNLAIQMKKCDDASVNFMIGWNGIIKFIRNHEMSTYPMYVGSSQTRWLSKRYIWMGALEVAVCDRLSSNLFNTLASEVAWVGTLVKRIQYILPSFLLPRSWFSSLQRIVLGKFTCIIILWCAELSWVTCIVELMLKNILNWTNILHMVSCT